MVCHARSSAVDGAVDDPLHLQQMDFYPASWLNHCKLIAGGREGGRPAKLLKFGEFKVGFTRYIGGLCFARLGREPTFLILSRSPAAGQKFMGPGLGGGGTAAGCLRCVVGFLEKSGLCQAATCSRRAWYSTAYASSSRAFSLAWLKARRFCIAASVAPWLRLRAESRGSAFGRDGDQRFAIDSSCLAPTHDEIDMSVPDECELR